MARILFFVLLGIAAYVGYRLWLAGARRRRRDEAAAGEPMLRCAHCGLNVPKSEAIGEAGRWYCSEAHRRLGRDEA